MAVCGYTPNEVKHGGNKVSALFLWREREKDRESV